MVYQGEDLYGILHRFDESDFSYSQFEGLRVDGLEGIDEDGQITPNSVVEDPSQFNKGSSSAPPTSHQELTFSKEKTKAPISFPPASFYLSAAEERAPLKGLLFLKPPKFKYHINHLKKKVD